MKIVKTNAGGVLTKVEKNYFGGAYSFFEKLKKSGVGSPKILYTSGIPHFDELRLSLVNEPAFVNFELMKNGLVVRLNFHQQIRSVGIRLSDIMHIHLLAQAVEIKDTRKLGLGNKIIHRGELKIIDKEGIASKFDILTQDVKAVESFFERKELRYFFTTEISSDPPEKDYGVRYIKFLEWFT